MIEIRARQRECRYCEFISSGPRMDEHVRTFHPDRETAREAYQRVLWATGSIRQARTAYNRALVPDGPGRYERVSLRTMAQ
jgi:hypothetical protein